MGPAVIDHTKVWQACSEAANTAAGSLMAGCDWPMRHFSQVYFVLSIICTPFL